MTALAGGVLGPEAAHLDQHLASSIDPATRERLWASAASMLARGPVADAGGAGRTGLALGYVQSGKTTSITALVAAAADQGYRLVIALLGGTNLLLNQNRSRVETALGIDTREDYVWVTVPNPSGPAGARALGEWLRRGRVVLVPVLKHAGRIRAVAGALERIAGNDLPVLVVDDEADQASLNTQGENAESKTYEAIRLLRAAVPNHLYVQYTATPYAPLLLGADDLLLPEFVEFLSPGPGYVGGREFFVDFADTVVRDVPALDEQVARALPLSLPKSLVDALGSFVAGAALLLHTDAGGAPVSMLVHSTQRNDVQARYHFLLERQINAWRDAAEKAATFPDLPPSIVAERRKLVGLGAADAPDEVLLDGVRLVLREATLWLVNSVNALNRVDWKVAPIHIIVGGNKLDRGYTVEGLTVTYMNRPPSTQVDTLEQRARAFGYRRDQLPYCQFFATRRTVKSLRDIVFTEYDLRARLRDHIEGGGSIVSWAHEVGLLLPAGMKPTRDVVVRALSSQLFGWYSLRQPSLDDDDRSHNEALVRSLGLFDSPYVDYGRLQHRMLTLPLDEVVESLLKPWRVAGYSAGWRPDDIIDAMRRNPDARDRVEVLLLEDAGRARTRKWDDATGFVNLFQGEDVQRVPGRPFYPGDRAVPGLDTDPDKLAVQVHRVVRRGYGDSFELLAPAVYLGSRPIVKKV